MKTAPLSRIEPAPLTRARVAALYPKSDPKAVAEVQDTLVARELGICAAWYEGGAFKFALGKVVD